MNMEDSFKKERTELGNQSVVHVFTGIGGIAATLAGIGVGLLAENKEPRIAGVVVALIGAAVVFHSWKQESIVTEKQIALTAKESTSGLVDALHDNAVSLSPAQKEALYKHEHEKAKKQWAEKMEEKMMEAAIDSSMHPH